MNGTETQPEAPAPVEVVAPARRKSLFREYAEAILIAVLLALVIRQCGVQAFTIPSGSMMDTLLVGDYILVNKFLYGAELPFTDTHLPGLRKPERGDIVVFRYPVNPEQHFVKRVVGVPGDRVRLINKRVRVNGVFLQEKYALYSRRDYDTYRDQFPVPGLAASSVESAWWSQMRELVQGGELVVPPGQYFVLGDNRDRSLDSRYWGFVPRENIIGRPLLIYWSVATPDPRRAPAPRRDGGKLIDLAHTAAQFFANIRWNRFLQLVS